MKWEHQIYKELWLDIKNQIAPTVGNILLVAEFFYGGCFERIVLDLLITREGKK